MDQHSTIAAIGEVARAHGLDVTARDGTVSVSGRFTPGDAGDLSDLESHAHEILRLCRVTRSGSTWGLEGVARYVAVENGRFELNRSGIDKRLCRAISFVR